MPRVRESHSGTNFAHPVRDARPRLGRFEMKSLSAVVLYDEPTFSQLLEDLLRSWTAYNVKVARPHFATRFVGAWTQWLQTSDVFVVGLHRRYPLGLRSEGAAVAETMLQKGKKTLIVSLDSCGADLECPFYWDLGSRTSFLDTVAKCLSEPVPHLVTRQRFLARFKDELAIPHGH